MDRTLILGLGNPDPSLEGTYHNAGIIVVRRLAEIAARDGGGDVSPVFRPYKDLFSYCTIDRRTFVISSVFMNESGRAAKEAVRVLKAAPADLIVAHDDSDIAIGDCKIVRGGRAAGHKGIQSIIDHLGTEDFARIRIGIRERNEVRRRKAGDFVLSPITASDKRILEEVAASVASRLWSASPK